MQKTKASVPVASFAVLMLIVACVFAGQRASRERSEIRRALVGGWEIESRYVQGGKGILQPPKLNGFLIASQTHSVSASPLADQPDASRISVERNQWTDSGQTVQRIYQTTSANSRLDAVRTEFAPQKATFSRTLQAEEEKLLRSIVGSDARKILSSELIVRRLPDQPTEVYTKDRLIRIADSHVDVYRRVEGEVKPQGEPSGSLKGAFEMRWRSSGKGERRADLFGFLLETPTLSVGLVPFASKPEAHLVYAARSTFSGTSQRADLFFVTCSANAAQASQILTDFPAEPFSFSQELNEEESARLEAAGVGARELSGVRLYVQRSADSPTHIYAGDQLFIVDKEFVDGYSLVRPN